MRTAEKTTGRAFGAPSVLTALNTAGLPLILWGLMAGRRWMQARS
jgi:hypothetical protein